MNKEISTETSTLPYVKQTAGAGGNLLYDEGSSNLVLCDYLEGWNGAEGSEREVQEKGDTCIVYVYIQLIHFTV